MALRKDNRRLHKKRKEGEGDRTCGHSREKRRGNFELRETITHRARKKGAFYEKEREGTL